MNISLRLDVNVFDAKNIIKWLDNEDVTKYLNEDINSKTSLIDIINSNRADLLTCYLNKDGRFFLIDDRKNHSIGFLTLFTVITKKEYEVVIVIGNPNNWGKQYAHMALKQIMREIFFLWRIDKLLARIHIDNHRSINLFKHLGFKQSLIKNNHIHFEINFNEYLNTLRNSSNN